MTLLDWKTQYSVGDPSVDHEHRELIASINQLYLGVDECADARDIESQLGEICAVIAAHFALEERLMRKAKYPEYQAHKADHENLLDQIHELMDQFASDPQKGRELLRQRLENWFLVHFSGFDARLHGMLA